MSAQRHQFSYEKEQHAAAWTTDYVFSQLIPYIGSKRKLLELVRLALAQTTIRPGDLFVDLFAGSGVVARMAKTLGFRVFANDWEPYAGELNRCYIECNAPPPFAALGSYEAALAALNALPPREDWVTRHLCPSDDDHYDLDRDRMFFTRKNGMVIDAMRVQIEQWEQQGALSPREKACLLAPLLFQTCYTSNTSGVFKGFHHGWGGRTRTALYRILAPCRLKAAVLCDNGLANEVFCADSRACAVSMARERLPIKVAYLDPPYNQHPYGSNYHVLNSVALWDRPQLSEKIEGRNKAAIRADWRTERRSSYNHKGEAAQAYASLLNALEAEYILTSYSTDGMIPLEHMVRSCLDRGATQVVLRTYKRYRVSAQRFSAKPVNVEFVLIVHTSRPHSGAGVDAICEQIRCAEAVALEEHPETAVRRSPGGSDPTLVR